MKMQNGCFVLFISVFYAVGFGLLGCGLWNVMRSSQAGAWPTVPGKTTHLAIDEHPGSEGGTSYEVKVKYTYTVGGVAYEGSRLAFGYGGSSGRDAHERIYQKLQAAKTVAVHYDPSEPSVSCLSHGVHRSIQIMLAFACTWLLFVIGFTVLFWLFSLSDTVLLDNLSVQ